MLEELTIRNYAIIDKLTVSFERGLTLLTGETGAGKSILIGALGFILGAKADTSIIRSGAEEVIVSASFGIDTNENAKAWLTEHDIETEDGTVVIRRSLKKTGRGSIYVQSSVVVRQDLIDFASTLIEIHGQKDSHVLVKKETQRGLLDRYACLGEKLNAYGVVYSKLCSKRKLLDTKSTSESERQREVEMLKFAVDEINEAALKNNEEEELSQEERKLSEYEKLYSLLSQTKDLLQDGESIVSKLKKAKSNMEASSAIDSNLLDASRRIGDSFYELEDLALSISSYCDNLLFDPDRLEQIESRMAVIQKMKRKYGATVQDVLKYKEESEERLSSLENWELDMAGLEAEVKVLEEDAYRKASEISAIRVSEAKKLDSFVKGVIATLGMPNADFVTRITNIPLADGKVVISNHGMDDVEFYVSANKGEPLRPLSDVASGGELSRVMLALKTAFADYNGDVTMVFDEIDTGIGGEVALAVGQHLAGLAKKMQVLCITHLASIAVRADNHYRVEKRVEGERTVTSVSVLEIDERVKEIARMLSGDADSPASIGHAKDLLSRFGKSWGHNG